VARRRSPAFGPDHLASSAVIEIQRAPSPFTLAARSESSVRHDLPSRDEIGPDTRLRFGVAVARAFPDRSIAVSGPRQPEAAGGGK
jgi:hypothetical protein